MRAGARQDRSAIATYAVVADLWRFAGRETALFAPEEPWPTPAAGFPPRHWLARYLDRYPSGRFTVEAKERLAGSRGTSRDLRQEREAQSNGDAESRSWLALVPSHSCPGLRSKRQPHGATHARRQRATRKARTCLFR